MRATIPLLSAGLLAIAVGPFTTAGENLVLTLIPKAFQQNPSLEMTVFSEVTDIGKKLGAISPQRPAYYALAPGHYHANYNLPGNEPAKPEELESMLRMGLHSRGYEPSDAKHPPAALITYTWGAHFYPDVPEDTLGEQVVLPNIMERAVLVGGDKFAKELGRALVERSNIYAASASPLAAKIADRQFRQFDGPRSQEDADRNALNIQFDMGAAAGLSMMNGVADPVRLFLQRDPRNEALVSQAADDCYYVIVSAYDYRSVAENHRQLLWRTRMTVNARSVAQSHALPLLISNTAPYLASDMANPDVLIRRSLRTPKVEVGTPTPVEETPER